MLGNNFFGENCPRTQSLPHSAYAQLWNVHGAPDPSSVYVLYCVYSMGHCIKSFCRPYDSYRYAHNDNIPPEWNILGKYVRVFCVQLVLTTVLDDFCLIEKGMSCCLQHARRACMRGRWTICQHCFPCIF